MVSASLFNVLGIKSALGRLLLPEDNRVDPPAVIVLGPSRLQVTVKEGRNRQVRKMCEAIGHPVTALRRVAIGPLRDSRLKIGHWRELSPQEVERLRKATAGTK